jgi:hypothetical protein
VDPDSRWAATAARIRTIWFLTAMIPVMVIAGILTLLAVLASSPLMIYSGLKGGHLKDPRTATKGNGSS